MVARFVARGRGVEVHEPRNPRSLRSVIGIARSRDVGVVISPEAQPVVARLAAAQVVALFPRRPDEADVADARIAIEESGSYAHPAFAAVLFRIARQHLRDRNVADTLSARELDVARLLAAHHPNRVIAARLFVSEHTVRNHLANIYRKLDVASRVEAIALLDGALTPPIEAGESAQADATD